MYDKVCRACGARLSEFYNTGMLGCPDCYNAFGVEIETALKKIQGRTFHVGKQPQISVDDKLLLRKYKDLLNKKETAGLEGRFQDMATYGVQIAEIMEELKKRRLI